MGVLRCGVKNLRPDFSLVPVSRLRKRHKKPAGESGLWGITI